MADLTVMTWNVQNLFPAGHPDGPTTQQDYDDKVAALAGVINAAADRGKCSDPIIENA
ncbi:MAG: hypothetical protein ACRD0W_13215 [Acidimicrobiales bacterium]